ncbi:ParB N-terminal domain-containing protein [Streptomyces sp. NPDC020472]|uniref:ParB N-terminal domain-containing protein n=1 Tax=Streptomyces sp. NPDC020472 TaxID=3365075 RepID=UPI0037ABEFC5
MTVLANIPEQLLPLAVPIAELTPYYRNPRTGDIPAIAESLTVNGQYRAVVVNKGTHTGRPNEILAGNHTVAAAQQLGWEQIAATWVDVDDEAAARIVIVDNRTNDLAGYDTALLAEVLSEIPDLGGTG